MKIAFDIGPTKDSSQFRGMGTYTSELLKALTKLKTKNTEIFPVDVFEAQTSSYDIVHFTSFKPFEVSLPLTKPAKTKFVTTIYDMIPHIYPVNYPPGVKGAIKWQINKLLLKSNIDAIVTISETSKKDICRFTGISPDRVFVTYLGVKEEYLKSLGQEFLNTIKRKYSLPEKFVFYFGDVNFNKNIPTLVKACERLNIPLVIGGKQAVEISGMDLNHPENMHLRRVNWENVLKIGYVSDEDANAIMKLSICLVQPSFYEGFGLSVVHAFAAGCPVVASKTQALVEIGGDACLYFDADNVKELSDAIVKIGKDEIFAKHLRELGRKRSVKYSWKETAEKTLKIYESL